MNESSTPEPLLSGGVPQNHRLWATFTHLAAFAGYFLPPVGHLLGPLILWLIKKNEMPFVDDQGKEAINFQITMTLATLVSLALIPVLIGFVLLPAVVIFQVVFVILAAVKANDGVFYRYPLCIRFFR